MSYTLTPSVPLSLKGEGEDNKKEGRKPLLDTPYFGGNFGNLGKFVPKSL